MEDTPLSIFNQKPNQCQAFPSFQRRVAAQGGEVRITLTTQLEMKLQISNA